MAFCKHCGRKLEEGEVCSCIEEINKEEVSESTTSKMERKTIQVEDLLETVKKVYKNPCGEIHEIVQKLDIQKSVIYLAIQAVLSGVFAVSCAKKINDLISMGGSYTASYKFSSPKTFFLTIVYSMILSIILACLYYVGGKAVKSEMGYKEALSLASIKAIAASPVIILSIILFWTNPLVGIAVFFLGFLFSIFYLIYGMKGMKDISENKSLYLSFVVMVVFIIIYFMFAKKVALMYVPDSIKSGLSNLDFSSLLDLLNMFM